MAAGLHNVRIEPVNLAGTVSTPAVYAWRKVLARITWRKVGFPGGSWTRFADASHSSAGPGGHITRYLWTLDARWGAGCGCWLALIHPELVGTKPLLRYQLPNGVELGLTVTDKSGATGSAQIVVPPLKKKRGGGHR